MDGIVDTSEDYIIAATLDTKEDKINLVLTEIVPPSINLLTDLTHAIQVVDFPRGSRAMGFCV